MFVHSCFGKLVILIAFILLGLFVALLTVPSDKKMTEEMTDNIRQCIQASDSVQQDKIDETVNNFFNIFTTADTTANDKEIIDLFNKYNRLAIYRHTLYSTAYIHNNFKPEGTRVGFGIFGIVIPTVNFNDFLLRTGPIRRDYNQKLGGHTYSNDEDYGSNPDLGISYDTYEGGGSVDYSE